MFRFLLRHENKIFGAILLPIAVRCWMQLADSTKDQFIYNYHGIYSIPLLSLAVGLFSSIYTSVIAFILITKESPQARYHTFWPNVLAVLGGCGIYIFGILQPAETRPLGVTLPLLLIALGSALVVTSLFYLRRSFSVTPQAFSLRRSGPYAIVRHPIYAGNIISLSGLALLFGTCQALLLSIVISLLQLCRAYFEERLLLSEFPEYEAYMSKVGSFLPRMSFLMRKSLSRVRLLRCG